MWCDRVQLTEAVSRCSSPSVWADVYTEGGWKMLRTMYMYWVMVVTCQRATTQATCSGINLNWTPEGRWNSAGSWLQGCLHEAGVDVVLGCSRYVKMEDLCRQVKLVQEEVYNLHSIRETKSSLTSWEGYGLPYICWMNSIVGQNPSRRLCWVTIKVRWG